MNTIRFSYFSCAKDNQPKHKEMSEPDFMGFILKRRVRTREKIMMPAISGAIFRQGTTRAVENVEAIHVLFFDFDNAEEIVTEDQTLGGRPKKVKVCIKDPVQMDEVAKVMAGTGVSHLLYPTWSDSSAWPRFRLVIPLGNPVDPKNWEPTLVWIIQKLGLKDFKRGMDYSTMKDVARIYFLPGGLHVH